MPGRFVRFILPLFITSLLLGACQTQKKEPPKVNNQMPQNAGKPVITGIVDLGGLDINLGGGIPTQFTDNRYSPGEWLMVKGKNLGVESVTIDGTKVPVSRYFGTYPLFRIPTGLSPKKEHSLLINTSFGKSATKFDTLHYIFANDLDAGKTHIISTDREEDGGLNEDWQILNSEAKRPMFNLISDNSAYLFNMDVHKQSETEKLLEQADTYPVDIHTYHLAAPVTPEKLATTQVLVGSVPIDATLSNNSILLLLGKQSFTLVDVSNPLTPVNLGHTALPFNKGNNTTFVDGIFLDNNSKLAFLETYSNQVLLFDISDINKPKQLDSLALLPNKTIALSVDLEADPKDPLAFWVLEGPNYRITGSKLSQTYKKLVKKENLSDEKKVVNRIEKIKIEGDKLKKVRAIATPPKLASYFSVFGQDGRLYISSTKTDFLNADFQKGSRKTILKRIKKFLWDGISFGRIIAIDTETEKSETVASGVGVYYHLVDVPDIGPVFSLLKFGPTFSMPYVTPHWGVGVTSIGTYAKRKMNKRAAFPPYSVGFIAYQF